MTDFFIGDRASQWGTWQGPAGGQGSRAFDDFTNLPPDSRWDRAIHLRRLQGDFSQWIPSDQGSLSRAQLQGPGVFPMESLRWCEFWLYTISIAPNASDDFHMVWEIHTPSANPGGVTTINYGGNPTQQMLRQWVGPGSFTEAYRGKTPVVHGEWHWHCIGFRPSVGSTGQVVYKRDAATVFTQSAYQSTTQSGTHYPEIGFYTYWSVQGTDDALLAGLRVTDVEPMYPGGGGGGPAPAATVQITQPTDRSGSAVFVGTLPYQVKVFGMQGSGTLFVGTAPLGEFDEIPVTAPGNSTYTGTLDLSAAPAGGQTDGLYAALHNAAGAQIAGDTFNVVVFPPEQPPPPPGDDIEVGFASTGDDASTARLDYDDPGAVTIPASLIGSRTVPAADTPVAREAERFLAALGYGTKPPNEWFRIDTGELMTRRPDGTFTPKTGS